LYTLTISSSNFSQSPFPSIKSTARESEFLAKDSFILALVSTGISGQTGVTVGAEVTIGFISAMIGAAAPLESATTPKAAVVAAWIAPSYKCSKKGNFQQNESLTRK